MAEYSIGQLRGAFGAGKAMAERDSTIVKHYFHSFDEGGFIYRQGQIMSQVEEGPFKDLFLVEWFSWLTGCANGRQLVKASDMEGWRFYPTKAAFLEAYDKSAKRSCSH